MDLNTLRHYFSQSPAMTRLLRALEEKEWFARCERTLALNGLVLVVPYEVSWELRYAGLGVSLEQQVADDYWLIRRGVPVSKKPLSLELVVSELDAWFERHGEALSPGA